MRTFILSSPLCINAPMSSLLTSRIHIFTDSSVCRTVSLKRSSLTKQSRTLQKTLTCNGVSSETHESHAREYVKWSERNFAACLLVIRMKKCHILSYIVRFIPSASLRIPCMKLMVHATPDEDTVQTVSYQAQRHHEGAGFSRTTLL